MPSILRLCALALLFSLAVGCATPQQKQVRLSWAPVTTDTKGKAIANVRYEVYVRVNDGPEKRFGPVDAPSIQIPLRLRACDVIRAQVVSIRHGVRSGRSSPIEQRVPPSSGGPGCQQSAARSCAPLGDGTA